MAAEDLFHFAKCGELEALCSRLAGGDEDGPEEVVFQWLQVSATLGSEEAEDLADDIYEAALSRGGDETVALLHYEVAEWFIRGQNGVARSAEHGLLQLERAQELHLRESVELDADLLALRRELKGEHLSRFDVIFPGLVKQES